MICPKPLVNPLQRCVSLNKFRLLVFVFIFNYGNSLFDCIDSYICKSVNICNYQTMNYLYCNLELDETWRCTHLLAYHLGFQHFSSISNVTML